MNDFRVIFQGASEAASRYGGGGGDSGPGMEDMPQEVRAGFANLQKEMARRVPPLTAFFKSMGIEVSIKSMLKQSQIFTSYVGTIFQLMGALVDVMLAPLLPLLVPVARWIGSKIPILAEWAKKKGEELSAKLEPIRNFFQGHTWESGWRAVGGYIKEKMEDWQIPFLGKWGESLAGWFGDHPGWFTIGGIIAAVLAKKFVFALPGLLMKLTWWGAKAVNPFSTATKVAGTATAATKGVAGAADDAAKLSLLQKTKLDRLMKIAPWLVVGGGAISATSQYGGNKDAVGTGGANLMWGTDMASTGTMAGIGTVGGTGGLLPLLFAYLASDMFHGALQNDANFRKQVLDKSGNLLDPASNMKMYSELLMSQNLMPLDKRTGYAQGTWENDQALAGMNWWQRNLTGGPNLYDTKGGFSMVPYRPEALRTVERDQFLASGERGITFNIVNKEGAVVDTYTFPWAGGHWFQHAEELNEAGTKYDFEINNHGIMIGTGDG